jgi:hypothetical protein
MPFYFTPPEYVGVAWQGDNEFTVGTNFFGDAPPACIYDGKDVSSCTAYSYELPINDTSLLSVSVENTGFNINSATSWGWAQTLTFDCTGDWCGLGSFPCSMDIGMRYDKI